MKKVHKRTYLQKDKFFVTFRFISLYLSKRNFATDVWRATKSRTSLSSVCSIRSVSVSLKACFLRVISIRNL